MHFRGHCVASQHHRAPRGQHPHLRWDTQRHSKTRSQLLSQRDYVGHKPTAVMSFFSSSYIIHENAAPGPMVSTLALSPPHKARHPSFWISCLVKPMNEVVAASPGNTCTSHSDVSCLQRTSSGAGYICHALGASSWFLRLQVADTCEGVWRTCMRVLMTSGGCVSTTAVEAATNAAADVAAAGMGSPASRA
jgi:hypothetical protein